MSADVQATFCATLVDQWVHAGLRHAMVAPGSRSTPMALALAERADMAVHVFLDERSAGFAALGIGLATGVPAVVLCTSGTAATHFHAAVVEADLAGVPMIVITADRPPELQGVGAPQTIDQTELYGNAVRWFHDPGVASAGSAHLWRVLADEAMAAAVVDAGHPGPVHLNLPFREPLLGAVGALPARVDASPRPRRHTAADVGQAAAELDVERGLIIAGRGASAEAASMLASQRGWPILADPRSGCRSAPHAITTFDALLRVEHWRDAYRPRAVLHLGEPPASKVLGQWLQRLDVPHVQVHHQPRVIDPLGIITHRLVAPVHDTCVALAERSGPVDDEWFSGWASAETAARAAIEAVLDDDVLTEPAVARLLTGGSMPHGTQLVVSSSMPIRDVEWFGGDCDHVTVHANRGANGIDGVIATAIGIALGSGSPTVVLLGDVAYCHDASSLSALARRDIDLTVVVVDNDGGGIFSFLPPATALPGERFEQLFGTPHGTDLLALAAAHGLAAVNAGTRAELLAAVLAPGVSVVRVPSDRAVNVAVHDRLNAAVAAVIG